MTEQHAFLDSVNYVPTKDEKLPQELHWHTTYHVYLLIQLLPMLPAWGFMTMIKRNVTLNASIHIPITHKFRRKEPHDFVYAGTQLQAAIIKYRYGQDGAHLYGVNCDFGDKT